MQTHSSNGKIDTRTGKKRDWRWGAELESKRLLLLYTVSQEMTNSHCYGFCQEPITHASPFLSRGQDMFAFAALWFLGTLTSSAIYLLSIWVKGNKYIRVLQLSPTCSSTLFRSGTRRWTGKGWCGKENGPVPNKLFGYIILKSNLRSLSKSRARNWS